MSGSVVALNRWITPANQMMADILNLGWSVSEGWGIWGIGDTHALSFLLDSLGSATELELEIDVHVYLNEDRVYLSIEVWINDSLAGVMTFVDELNRAIWRFQFRPKMGEGNLQKVEFRISEIGSTGRTVQQLSSRDLTLALHRLRCNVGWGSIVNHGVGVTENLVTRTSRIEKRQSEREHSFVTRIRPVSRFTLAKKFESLGGGSDRQDGWTFGCEFGFFQRRWCGFESLGLLRWASISVQNLTIGLQKAFHDIGNIADLRVHEDADRCWGYSQMRYGLRVNHVTAKSGDVAAVARRISKNVEFLRRKLIEDLQDGSKLFVYRVIGRNLTDIEITELAEAVNRYGKNTLLLVEQASPGTDIPFSAIRIHDGLIRGFIDRFASLNGGIHPNDAGWEKVCRSALDLL